MNLADKLTNDTCERLFGKPYELLEYSDKVFVNAYIRDFLKPEWKPFEFQGQETNYQISNVGQVMNWKQNKKVDVKETPDGCYVASLKINGKWHQLPVHRMVAAAFIDNPHAYQEVVHIKEANWLNWYKNLKWTTRAQMVVEGKGNVGVHNSIHTEEEVINVVKLAKAGKKIKDIVTELGVSESFVIGILYRGEWKAITTKIGLPDVQRSITDSTTHEICRQLQAGVLPAIIATEMNVKPSLVYSIRSGKCHREISNQYDIPGLEKDDSASNKKCKKIFSLFEQGIMDTSEIISKLELENTKGVRKYISKLRQKFKNSDK